MLAKIWKKALLAICIIACIYNVMHKLVSRTSLEVQLKSVQNQKSIIDMLDTTEKDNESQETQNSSKTDKKENTVLNETKRDENTIVVIY